MKRYMYPLLLLSVGLMLCRDAVTLAFARESDQPFRPVGEQQHLLEARVDDLAR